MQLVLINAPVKTHSPHASLSPPLGLAYVAAALMDAGHLVSAVDFNVSGLNLSRVDRIVECDKPTVVGISAMTETYPGALVIARRLKEIDPSVVVVIGGAHPSIVPYDVLAEEAVDYVVVGGGERAMVELVASLTAGGGAFDEIAGLGFMRDGVPVVNKRTPLPDPDDLPFPARGIFPLELYANAINVLTATGSCPYRCPFCSAASIWEGRRKTRSPGSIVEELRMLVIDHGVDHVFFTDDIFTLDKRWVYRLLDALSGLEYPITWGCATRVDLVDGDLLRAMAAGGCTGIQFGVESGSQGILDSVKGISKAQVVTAVDAALAAGIDAVCSFMVPFPEDTEETLRETGDFMESLYLAGGKILLSYTAPYPGTYFYDHAKELGLTILTDRWDEFDAKHVVMETSQLSAAQIDAAVSAIAAKIGMHRSTG